jgi:hypothetical protein
MTTPITLDNTAVAAPTETITHVRIVRGRDAIVELKPQLVALSERCQQRGAMDYLLYFLTRPQFAVKIPHLILISSGSGSSSASGDLEGAVLMYEHTVLGCGTKAFVTDFHGGHRAVIAPPSKRAMVATMACHALMKAGALVVQLSFLDEMEGKAAVLQEAEERGRNGWMWAVDIREMVWSMPLRCTYDETLAQMGKHTRRNLRYYRRRAEAEIGCEFLVSPPLTLEDYFAANRASSYPVTEEIARWRFDSLSWLPGCVWLGMKDKDGNWLSLIAGRNHHGITEIDWQVNRAGLSDYSLSTVMRSYLLEYEIGRGTKWLHFEGGTPHSIRNTLGREKVVDLMVMRRSMLTFVLRSLPQSIARNSSHLTRVLVDPKVEWTKL